MAKIYPTIGEYNQLFQKEGGNAFRSLHGITLLPSRTSPIKVLLFGSGAYAAVFKGILNGKTYAIRCFLSAEDETNSRYKSICNYLRNINAAWKTECEFIEDEISIGGYSYPILKMEWMNGLLINQFVSNNLDENSVLAELQSQLISVSENLERNKIGHGDIQCGNVIVTGTTSHFQVKLIDYDGLFIPGFEYRKSNEKGRSEFQHPKRTLNHFGPEMDRFSFWVIITALEALKVDKTLWREVMQGGFNTLDNFLFTIQDFLNPYQSNLFNRLHRLNSSSLNFYLETLKFLCQSEVSAIPRPALYENSKNVNSIGSTANKRPISDTPKNESGMDPSKYLIKTTNVDATVLTSTFQRLGSTPLELDKNAYNGKVILISNGKETKQIRLDNVSVIFISFD